MKIGDKLDALELGFNAIDLKTILKDTGYVVPQSSADNFTKIPIEVEQKILDIKKAQLKYEVIEETASFECQFCKEKNSTNYRKEKETETVFLVCGNCNIVAEVK